jgi:hypothetical protein
MKRLPKKVGALWLQLAYERVRLVFLLIAVAAGCSSGKAGDDIGRHDAVPLGISSDINDSDVQDRLKLSDGQRRQISDFEKQRRQEHKALTDTANGKRSLNWAETKKIDDAFRKRVESVLTPEESNQWLRLQRLSTVAIFGPYRRLDQEEARDELKLKDEQLKAISDLQIEFCRECQRLAGKYEDLDAPRDKHFFATPFFLETQEAADGFDARFDSLMDKILDEKQLERWSQLEWQRAGADRGVEVFLDEQVIKYLQLTDNQRDKLKKLAAETTAQVDVLEKEKKHFDAMKARPASVQKGVELLRADQRQRWQLMVGRPSRSPLKP